jgi:hypothetical protein
MGELLWYKFTEHNDHEGETWHFYILLTEEEADHLNMLVDDDVYELTGPIEESYIENKIKWQDDCGYMPKHNKCGRPKLNILDITFEDVDEDDPFYKGQAWM